MGRTRHRRRVHRPHHRRILLALDPRPPSRRHRPPLDIGIEVPAGPSTPARTWRAAWNADTALTDPHDGRVLAPRSQLWASHSGGHQQIGCIYTAQGLEYHHSGVIIGPDLIWNDGHWHARPEHSEDSHLRGLPPSSTSAMPSIPTASCSPAAHMPPASTPPTPPPTACCGH
ncbi:DNA/RNA helicase domain-containing protein [Streptomyces nogalater]